MSHNSIKRCNLILECLCHNNYYENNFFLRFDVVSDDNKNNQPLALNIENIFLKFFFFA